MNNKNTMIQNEKTRYITAWILITIFIIVIVVFCVYNKSAFMMVFGKISINLNEYDKSVSYIYSNPADFTDILSQERDGQSYISYKTTDNIGFFTINASDNEIYSVDSYINMEKFLSLSLTKKYKSIDKMLQPICNKSDILATEIGILKLSSESALKNWSFLNINFDTSRNIELNSSSKIYTITTSYIDSILNLKLNIE